MKAAAAVGLAASVCAVFIAAEPTVAAGPYDPFAGNEGFLVFIEGDATMTDNESEGPIAIGGDLTVGGNYQLGFVTPGTYTADGESRPSALVVGGAIDWAGSTAGARTAVLADANVNIGVMTDSYARDVDNNGAAVNTRVLPADDYGASPRIELNVRQDPSTVQWTSPIDFGSAFATFRTRSADIAQCAQTVTLTIPGGGPVQRPIPPGTGQLNIAIVPGQTNVLHLTGEELNHIGALNYTTAPTATSPLIINVDTTATGGVYEWTGFTSAGAFDQRYIMFNFPAATAITLPGAAPTVEGSIYAPTAILTDNSPSNVEGSIVAAGYSQGSPPAGGGGEVHYFPFSAQVSCGAGPSPSPSPSLSPSGAPPPPLSPSPTDTPTGYPPAPDGTLPTTGTSVASGLLWGGGTLLAGVLMVIASRARHSTRRR